MLFNVKPNYPIAKLVYVLLGSLLGGSVFLDSYSTIIILLIGCSLALSIASKIKLAVKVNLFSGFIEVGYSLFGFFKSKEKKSLNEFKQVSIQQLADRYFGIGLELHSGEFLLLDKKPTLDRATERKEAISGKINHLLELEE